VLEDSVLVVDDDQATRDSLASVLKGAGIEVFVASDPSEAMTLRGLQHPSAVVVDHQLAGHTGVELAQRLKQEDPDTPVLLLTGLASLDSALAASSQLDGLLVKPLVPQAFIQTVRNALAQRALAVENQRLGERVQQLQSEAAEAVQAAQAAQAAQVQAAQVAQAAQAQAAQAAQAAQVQAAQVQAAQAAAAQAQAQAQVQAAQAVAPPPAPTMVAPPPPPPVEEPVPEIPSRALVEEQIDKALTVAQRDSSALAVLFVELDGWQEVSAQYGGRVAEQVTLEMTSRLSVQRRKSDVVARAGTDKFVVACTDVKSEADAQRIASLIIDATARPVVADGVEHWLRATVGIVVTNPATAQEKADAVLENAELAMYWARDEGRASRLFDASMRERVVARYEIEHGLQSAMDNGELALFYQPVVDLHSGQVVGAEALLRWQRPDQGVMLPGEFLDVAAEVGMSEALSRWTVDRAFTELALWRDAEHLPEQFRLTLNVSDHELADPQFAATFEELAAKHGIAPSMVSIDLSERAARAAAGMDGALARLSSLGVLFSLDDFGAGECKLSWLQDLPVNALKIAPEFVAALDSAANPHGAAMVRALIALGHELHLIMIAEGVETPAQAAALRVIGCELAQGYHLGHPGPREQVWAAPGA